MSAATAGAPPRYRVENIPAELIAHPRWCVFQIIHRADGTTKKTPLIAGVRPVPGARTKAESNDPATWRSFEVALADADARGLYLAFVFDRELGLFFLDADEVVQLDGTLRPDVALLRDQLDTYTEWSASGDSLHIIGRGAFPERSANRPVPEGCKPLERYPLHGPHFCIFTGNTLPGLGTIEERGDTLAALFPPGAASHANGSTDSAGYRGPAGPLTDDEIAGIIAWAGPFWTDGRRHHLALYLSGELARQGVSREQGAAIIERCAGDDGDPGAKLTACHDTYDKRDAGETVSGWQSLQDVCNLSLDDLAPLDAILDGFWRRHNAGNPPRRGERDRARAATRTNARPWPTLDDAALYGLAGDVVRTIEPHTEGDPVAVLVNFLVMFGSAIGRSPYARVGAARHRVNLSAVLVGETARARKGTAHGEAQRVMERADPYWKVRVQGGLSSGEGLIYAVRDPIFKPNKDGEMKLVDPGVDDKRLLAVESEYSSVLRVAGRDGNTLSELMRRAWDGDDLRTLTRSAPLMATAPHISVLGHITTSELLRELTETYQANGFANRNLFICVCRSRELPHGGALPDADVSALADRVRVALDFARKTGEVRRDDETNRVWEVVYSRLTAARPGMLGAITARAEAQVLRLSLGHALLDGSPLIRRVHLEAALALWQYAEDSARFIFGDAIGDPVADQILTALRRAGRMTQTQISELFARNQKAGRLEHALAALLAAGLVRTWAGEVTSGRPPTYWEAV